MASDRHISLPLHEFVEIIKKNKNKESIAETVIGVDIKKRIKQVSLKEKTPKYELMQWVESGNFIMNGIHVDRDRKVPVALYEGEKRALTSGTYFVFRVKNPSLNKNYLSLLFQKELLDKYSLWLAGKGIRGELAWKDFLRISISVPDLEFQEKVVNKYETVNKYIEIKKRINELLERKMRVYFHILFGDLGEWEIKTFGELFSIIGGGGPPRSNKAQRERYFCKEGGIPWLQVKDVTKQQSKFVSYTSEQLTQDGLIRGKCKIVPSGSVVVVGSGVNAKALGQCMISFCDLVLNTTLWGFKGNTLAGGGEPIPTTYIYFLIKENVDTLKRMINASTDRVSFDVKRFTAFKVKIPKNKDLIDKFNNFCEPIFELQKNNEQIIQKLLRLQKCSIESLD